MSIRVALTHRTTYTYDRKIQLGPQVIRLRPAPHTRPKVVSYSQTLSPEKHFLNWQQDPFGNYQARAVFEELTDHFEVLIDLVVDMIAINPFDFFVDEDVFHAPFSYREDLARDLAPYLVDELRGTEFDALGDELKARWLESEGQEVRTIDFLVALNQRVFDLVDYVVRMEPGVQSPEETLTKKSGSCRDSAWLLVNLLRRVGIAARFVSGYLIQLAPDERFEGEANGPEADFTDLHAWAEVFIPGAGWIGLDATSGLFAGEGHIPLAATPLPGSAAPISGELEACNVEFDFDMQVRRLREPARISKPLTDLQWEAVDQAGQAVDEVLEAEDVRLTMGGEPTFIASSDRDADEWTIAAVGPTKRQFADDLARRLLKTFASGGVLTHGQGKWYPGEPLPRWAYSIIWREDGEPIWNNLDLIEGEAPNRVVTPETAGRFTQSLAEALDLQPDFAQALFEDPADFVLRERNLPDNLTPGDSKLEDPVERERLARIFENGLSQPAAFVLPLQEAQADTQFGRATKWMSEIWETRRNALCLIPGDSPAGFRLPMKSLPWVDPAFYPVIQQVDPFVERPALAETFVRRQKRKPNTPSGDQGVEARKAPAAPLGLQAELSGNPVRTALVVQPRDGHLNVFLPPTSTLEAYLDLITSIEMIAEELNQPVRIEGYGPPRDPRLNEIKVTPDPGVIEVNIHPASKWSELRDNTKRLYDEARACGLDASGFMLDGRPTGSGGGAHITLGGAQAGDSPFLRRPDVLGSIIRFWQAHPSLSYLFAGMFIGPTSQAPRIDEARSDLLFEMELALQQLPEMGEIGFPPWLVDRVLRHLLVDVTGNTHRAEICIDKLYSPDGPTGRLGLVEFRGFEMPPHWQMNAAQQLLLRAIVAWFWKRPNTAPLVDHGQGLTDRFLLPDVLWGDFKTVLSEVSAGLGVELDPEWFRAQFDFRFPLAGRIEHDGYALELRNALEPWHVLGEESAASGTTRFVDSSLERLQVKLVTPHGAAALKVACQGYELPLQPGLREGEQVCGVRFRSWLPASCLHPTIPPHGPLVFDLFDPRQGRAVAGCTYHTSHPGGRNFETRPVNALEAEGRRLARFSPFGHTAGLNGLSSPIQKPGFPYTLDLRLLS